VRINVLGEFMGFTLICEEKLIGGILNWTFFVFWSGFHGSSLRRGDNLCYSFVNLGNLIVSVVLVLCIGITVGREHKRPFMRVHPIT
jgi:hypothetical protein